MTLKELYDRIGADYEFVTGVLRIEKLIDKHIRKFPDSGVVEALIDAGKTMDAKALFESSHAMKGVCSNLGLLSLAGAASEISEEFRPGNPRRMTDGQVREKIALIEETYKNTVDGIRGYAAGN